MEKEMEGNTITYVGASNIISALGFSTQENVNNIAKAISGIGAYSENRMAAQIDCGKLNKCSAHYDLEEYLPLEQLMILSIMDVVKQSGVDLSSKQSAVIFSTTKGNIDLLSHKNDLSDDRIYLWNMAKRVADYFSVANKPIVISNACISGLSAIIIASRLLREGKYKNIIVVGGDLLTDFVITGFSSFKSLSNGLCKPYDAQRDGLTLGEACASILITGDRSLSSGVIIEGGAITNDANHISGPSRTGDGLAYAIEGAMTQSNLSSVDISFVNAHGTATLYNDEMEAKAINICGLQNIPTTSLKSYFGHTLGAAGVLETIICVEQLKKGILFGTHGFADLGVSLPLLVLGSNREIDMKHCIKTASGFGGCNAAIVLSLETYSKSINGKHNSDCQPVAKCAIGEGKVRVNDTVLIDSDTDFPTFSRMVFKALDKPNMKFYKMDDLSKLAYLTVEYLLEKNPYRPKELAIVLANRSSSLDTDIKHQNILNQHLQEGTSPAVFVYTLPNVSLGEICIRHKIQGENTFFIESEMSNDFLEKYAQTVLAQNDCKAVIYGWCEKINEQYSSQMTLIEKKYDNTN